MILKAAPKDAALIGPLFEEYRQFYGKRANPDGAQRFIEERLRQNESVIFFALLGGRAVGFAQLYPIFSSLSMRRSWILNDLYVRPEARRRRIGRALLEHAEDHARATGARALTLKTAADNARAQALYQSAGWRQDFRFVNYDRTVD